MSGTSNKPNRLAHIAALVGAGATAATVAHLAASRKSSARRRPRPSRAAGCRSRPTRPSSRLIESVAAATAKARDHRRGAAGLRRARLPLDGLARRPRLPRRQERARPAAAVARSGTSGTRRKFEAFRALTAAARRCAPGIGLPGRVAATGRPAWIVDVTCDAELPARRGRRRGRPARRVLLPDPDRRRDLRRHRVLLAAGRHARRPPARGHRAHRPPARPPDRRPRSSATALRESESRFRSVAESANDAIVAADQNGDIISWNRGAELMFGHVEDEVVGKRALDPDARALPPDARRRHRARRRGRHGRLAPDRPDRRGRRPAQGRPRVPARALARDVGDRRRALLQRHHPRHLRAQEGRGEAQGRARDRAGPDRRGRPRRHDRASPTRAPTSCSATTASRSSAARSRSSSPSAPARWSPSASPPCWRATRERLAGRPRHGPRAVGPAQGRHRVPGRRHALGRCTPTTASS